MGEAALHEARQLRLIDRGDGRVLDRDAAAAVSVQDRLVAADPEAAGALAGGDLLRGAEEGTQPVRSPQDGQGVAVTAYRCGVFAGQTELVEGGVQQLAGVCSH